MALVLPSMDGKSRLVRRIEYSRRTLTFSGKTLLKTDDVDESIRGFMCVLSDAEDLSVHPVVFSTPRIRAVNNVTDDGRVETSRPYLFQGPRLVSVPFAECRCTNPACGTKSFEVKSLIAYNTRTIKRDVDVNGKTVSKTIRVSKADPGVQVHSIRDLRTVGAKCPSCGSPLSEILHKDWTLRDTKIVPAKYVDIVSKMLNDARAENADVPSFQSAVPEIVVMSSKDLGIDELPDGHLGGVIGELRGENVGYHIYDWNSAVRVDKTQSNLFLIGSEITLFSVADAQDLRNLNFGNSTSDLEYWGKVGFIPSDLRKRVFRYGEPGGTIAEAIKYRGEEI